MANQRNNNFKLHIDLLRLFALYNDHDHWLKRLLYRFYSITCMVFLFGYFTLSLLVDLWFELYSLEVFITSACVLVTICTTYIKSLLFLVKWDLLKRLIRDMDAHDFRPRNDEQRQMVHQFLSRNKTVLIAVTVLHTVSLVAWIMAPLFDDQYRNLPYPIWYSFGPFNSTLDGIYQVTYVHQSIAAFICAVLTALLDTFTYNSMAFIRFKCDILVDNIRNLESEDADKELIGCIDDYIDIVW